jgi:hypothetical protein
MIKQIIYKEVIEIDGREYTVFNRDYSESINEAIKDQIIENDNQEIINYIVDDIVNLDNH